MSKLTHGVLQGLAILVQLANLTSGVVPAKYQPVVLAVVGLAQAIMALQINHPSGGGASGSQSDK